MENIIYNELVRRGYQVDIGVVEVFDKNANGSNIKKQLEVDFVINKGYERFYVQSAYSYYDEEKKAQETASLKNIPDAFERIIVVGNDIKRYRDENGYLIINLMDFLLEEF